MFKHLLKALQNNIHSHYKCRNCVFSIFPSLSLCCFSKACNRVRSMKMGSIEVVKTVFTYDSHIYYFTVVCSDCNSEKKNMQRRHFAFNFPYIQVSRDLFRPHLEIISIWKLSRQVRCLFFLLKSLTSFLFLLSFMLTVDQLHLFLLSHLVLLTLPV